jgi:hypothetical protein
LAGGLAAGCGKKKRGSGPDLSNPKSAAIAFTRAIETGDVNTAQVAAYASGIEIELVEAMAQAMPELKKLDEAAVAKYGEEARTILENPAMLNSSKALEEAEVAMDAGRAKLTNKQGQVITQLKEINGDWKVDVGVSIAGRDVSQRVPALRALAKTAAEVTEGIKAGKFATAADAKRELQMKMVVELHGGKPPETQPSSVLAPSTKTAPPGDDLGLP